MPEVVFIDADRNLALLFDDGVILFGVLYLEAIFSLLTGFLFISR